MISVVDPTGKDELVERAASVLEPCQNATAGRIEELELNGPAGLLLDDDCARAYLTAAHEIADFDLHDVTPAQFAVYGEIEHRAIAQPTFAVKPEPNGPDLS
jgi:hypothetical protein